MWLWQVGTYMCGTHELPGPHPMLGYKTHTLQFFMHPTDTATFKLHQLAASVDHWPISAGRKGKRWREGGDNGG